MTIHYMNWVIGGLIAVGVWSVINLASWWAVYGRFKAKWHYPILLGQINKYSDWLKDNGWCFIGKMYETQEVRCVFHQTMANITSGHEDRAEALQEALARFSEELRALEGP